VQGISSRGGEKNIQFLEKEEKVAGRAGEEEGVYSLHSGKKGEEKHPTYAVFQKGREGTFNYKRRGVCI